MTQGNWTNLTPSIEIDYFADWLTCENILKEFGEPGFSNVVRVLSWPSISDSPISIEFTCSRGEDGKLLGIAAHYTMDGIQKPFLFMVHPDHQRTGIGTKLIDHVAAEYASRNGHEYLYEQSWGDVEVSESAANWANKYVPSVYAKRVTNEE